MRRTKLQFESSQTYSLRKAVSQRVIGHTDAYAFLTQISNSSRDSNFKLNSKLLLDRPTIDPSKFSQTNSVESNVKLMSLLRLVQFVSCEVGPRIKCQKQASEQRSRLK